MMMFSELLRFVRFHRYPLLIAGIAWWICITTYVPGSWLTGWDTLHPEFNFPLAFERIFSGVWREEQGFGTVAGHSHMSELPRYVVLWIFSLVAPLSMVRYLYIFACFIAGPVGVYYFVTYILPAKDAGHAAFLSGLMYICNIAVLHHLLVPFEMFPTHYAFLPWLFLYATKYIREQSRMSLVVFSALTFFASPMAYAAQLWYVYCISLVMYTSVISWKAAGHAFKQLVVICAVTVCINAFWLFPHLYHVIHNAHWIPESHINSLFSERMFLYNQSRGTFYDVAILQGALYDFLHYDGERFTSLFEDVSSHLNNPFIMGIGYAIFALVVFGMVLVVFRKNWYGIAIIPVFVGAYIFLTSASDVSRWIFSWLFTALPLVKEAMRSPYTKFSLVLLFSYSVFFGYAMWWVHSWFSWWGKKLATGIVAFFLIVYMLPLFQGKLIEKHMKVAIPDDYFSLFSFFREQDASSHVAFLPAQALWGWEYYRWGYQGAGFVWFGIPQTSIVRDADSWSPQNENFYAEFSYAMYSGNEKAVDRVLEKYSVSWVVIDHHKISPDDPKSTYLERIEDSAQKSNRLKKVQTFGAIDVYEVTLPYRMKTFGRVVRAVEAGPLYTYAQDDKAFEEYGTYYTKTSGEHGSDSSLPSIYYPFRSLFTGKGQDAHEFTVREEDGGYAVESIDDPSIRVTVPFIKGNGTYDSFDDALLPEREVSRCDRKKTGFVEKIPLPDGSIELISQDASNCLDIPLPNLTHRQGYIIHVDSKHYEGMSLLFALVNKNSNRQDILSQLPYADTMSYFIVPPMEMYGQGYGLFFDNVGIGHIPTRNQLGRIRVQPFPYEYIRSLKLVSDTIVSNRLFVYAQNYDNGWMAYLVHCDDDSLRCRIQKTMPMLFGRRLNDHVEVNNWANGWIVDDVCPPAMTDDECRSSIKSLFWPQYTEYAGFLVAICTFSVVLFRKKYAAGIVR